MSHNSEQQSIATAGLRPTPGGVRADDGGPQPVLRRRPQNAVTAGMTRWPRISMRVIEGASGTDPW